MRLSFCCLHVLIAISLLPACPTKDDGDQTTDGPSTTGGATTGPESGSDTGPTTGETNSDTTGSDTTGSDTTTSDTTGSDTTTSAATTSDSEGSFPAECDQADPTVSAAVELVIEGWSDDDDWWHDFDVLCMVDDVATDAGLVTTELTCDVDGSLLPAIVRMPKAPEGEVAWGAGVGVRLITQVGGDPDFGGIERRLQLRDGADDALLAAWLDRGLTDTKPVSTFAPLTFAFEYACSPMGVDVLRVDLEDPDGGMASIFSGQRGQLPIDDTQAYAIDVEEATGGHCCHFNEYFHILVRRVVTGG